MRNRSHPHRFSADSGIAAAPALEKSSDRPETTSDREARIAELRAQYLAGQYLTNATLLSKKIVEAHIDK